jgi:hypothetical protein
VLVESMIKRKGSGDKNGRYVVRNAWERKGKGKKERVWMSVQVVEKESEEERKETRESAKFHRGRLEGGRGREERRKMTAGSILLISAAPSTSHQLVEGGGEVPLAATVWTVSAPAVGVLESLAASGEDLEEETESSEGGRRSVIARGIHAGKAKA